MMQHILTLYYQHWRTFRGRVVKYFASSIVLRMIRIRQSLSRKGVVGGVILSMVFGIFSCNDEVDIIEEGKVIPVVYGFLNIGDTAQYIRVEKVFGEEGKDAYTTASDSSQIFFGPELEVQMSVDTSEGWYTLQRVDGAMEGFPRDSGEFYYKSNPLYKLLSAVLDFRTDAPVYLRLVLEGVPIATSSTRMVGPITMRFPIEPTVYWDHSKPLNVRIRTTRSARVFDIRLRFHIEERLFDNPGQVRQVVLDWTPLQLERRTPSVFQFFTIDAGALYAFLASHLEVDPNVQRRLVSFDIGVSAGGEEFEAYENLALANVGITGALELPLYSNIEGGLGIFSSVSHLTLEGYELDKSSMDSLVTQKILQPYNFVK